MLEFNVWDNKEIYRKYPKVSFAVLDYFMSESDISVRGGNIEFYINPNQYDDLDGWLAEEFAITPEKFYDSYHYFEELLENTKFYTSDTGEVVIELSDNPVLSKIDNPELDEITWMNLVDDSLAEFEDLTGVTAYTLGRSGRHVCVDLNLENLIGFDNLKDIVEKLQKQLIDNANKANLDESFGYDTSVNDSTTYEINAKFNDDIDFDTKIVDRDELYSFTTEIAEMYEDDEPENDLDAIITFLSDYDIYISASENKELKETVLESAFDEPDEVITFKKNVRLADDKEDIQFLIYELSGGVAEDACQAAFNEAAAHDVETVKDEVISAIDMYLEDNEYLGESEWEEVASKQVEDSNGFLTDYTMYTDGDRYIFMFGDKEIYTPDPDYADWEAETKESAWEWFNSYNGFEDEDDEDLYESKKSHSECFNTLMDTYKQIAIDLGEPDTVERLNALKQANVETIHEDYDDEDIDIFDGYYDPDDFDEEFELLDPFSFDIDYILSADITVKEDHDIDVHNESEVARNPDSYDGNWYYTAPDSGYPAGKIDDNIGILEDTFEILPDSIFDLQPGKYHITGYVQLSYCIEDLFVQHNNYDVTDTTNVTVRFEPNLSKVSSIKIEEFSDISESLNSDSVEIDKSILKRPKEFRYRLLDRMQGDCEYYLGNGNKQLKYLWANSVPEQIAYMRALYNSFHGNDIPEWISLMDIDEYEKKMLKLDESLDIDDELDHPEQEFDSAKTSINSSKLPAVYKMISIPTGSVGVDFGGGSFDNAVEYISDLGATLFVYDPYNRSAEHNKQVIKMLKDNGGADWAVNSNVLNVIKEPSARRAVLENISKITKSGAPIYITVYEGRGDGKEGPTKSGYQLNRKTQDYLEDIQEVFPDATRKGKLITAHNTRSSTSSINENTDVEDITASSDEYVYTYLESTKRSSTLTNNI